MFEINRYYTELPKSYLFSRIAKTVADFKSKHPDARIISMGIGDVTRPIAPAAIAGMTEAVKAMASADSFVGYGPEQGHAFLRSAIAETDFSSRGIDIADDEIFISDGAKSDIGNFTDILDSRIKVAVTDPVYPVYVDSNVMAGRGGHLLPDGRWSGISYMPCTESNGFVPELPRTAPDVIYLCYPNNPTGTALTRHQLGMFVDYARRHGALILFDAAYEAYIESADVPHSIYEIEGAKECAVEFRSFSKTAGFTGLRLGYTVVPKELYGLGADGSRVPLRQLWLRRQTTKFNGASYVIQCGAASLYTPEGREQIQQTIQYYKTNASVLREALQQAGLTVYGGVDSPYIWAKSPAGYGSEQFFNLLLERCHLVTTPGNGFGPSGEGFVRLTAFSSHQATREAVSRLSNLL
ncbi:MAG: LL-diaminopimelate aminotransferase [Muribaculaceae bacterium]|nr:LL-diaminopimelate aminotransferase [Muribaculaceae bacterium]